MDAGSRRGRGACFVKELLQLAFGGVEPCKLMNTLARKGPSSLLMTGQPDQETTKLSKAALNFEGFHLGAFDPSPRYRNDWLNLAKLTLLPVTPGPTLFALFLSIR